jgi:hypothetical protein
MQKEWDALVSQQLENKARYSEAAPNTWARKHTPAEIRQAIAKAGTAFSTFKDHAKYASQFKTLLEIPDGMVSREQFDGELCSDSVTMRDNCHV